MTAQRDDPWIGVHVLTEFVFCPRAGLLAYEQQADVEEDELAAPQLGYRPGALYWSMRQIKTQLTRQLTQMWLLGAATVAFLVTAVIADATSPAGLVLLIASAVMFILALKRVYRVIRLIVLRRRAIAARPQMPSQNATDNQKVTWWGLLNAGFESIPYKEVLRDERWRCAGKPWRVLRHGSVRIPVFRLKGNTSRLYRQHYARMAAYCHLIQTCEGAESPYGIVLLPNSYDGLTVPNSPASGKAFHQGLLEARRVVRESVSRNQDPPRPGNSRLCHACKIGRPRVYRMGITTTTRNGSTLPAYCFRGVDRRDYHSPCGDRFRWGPPHQRFFEKRGY
ncbi:MAG: hypothetical protein CMJ58_15130 [Planctomycetaceae bacterium]|nr:hypothetical protein [Planctomycetaceae bacterium]